MCSSTVFLTSPMPPSPHANSFVIGTAVITRHTQMVVPCAAGVVRVRVVCMVCACVCVWEKRRELGRGGGKRGSRRGDHVCPRASSGGAHACVHACVRACVRDTSVYTYHAHTHPLRRPGHWDPSLLLLL
jgi:hypothetical protein